MKLVKLKCDSCGAVLEVKDGQKIVTCDYCGFSFIVDDEVKRMEINKNIKYTDEARIKESSLKEKEIDYFYKDNKLKIFLDIFKNDNFVLIFVFSLLLIVGGIFSIGASFSEKEEEKDRVVIPMDAKKYKGENYKQVVQQLKDVGFEDVDAEPIYDLVTGWLTKDGEVEKVSIAGDTEFEEGDYFKEDDHVIVMYHTYKKNKKK